MKFDLLFRSLQSIFSSIIEMYLELIKVKSGLPTLMRLESSSVWFSFTEHHCHSSSNCPVKLSGQIVWLNCLVTLSGQIVWSHCLTKLSGQIVWSHCLVTLSGQIVWSNFIKFSFTEHHRCHPLSNCVVCQKLPPLGRDARSLFNTRQTSKEGMNNLTWSHHSKETPCLQIHSCAGFAILG